MITYIVAGRNDHYGINLDKRTAISLNCLAELCEEDDEIIYVDCNTPIGEQTLVEAIADTLTSRARKFLRSYRVTGDQMREAIGETSLPFSDELSRNVAIRRSNPRNTWILSTNCDIVIQPISTASFRQLVASLPLRFYLSPRIAIPIEEWLTLDRSDPSGAFELIESRIATGVRFPRERAEEWLRFDSVGDFQLAPREHWLAIRGCEEGMKQWGHSDANNARRLNLLDGGGRTPDLGDQICVAHLDHNLPVRGPKNETSMVHNDWNEWITQVTDYRSRNPENWGLSSTTLPEVRFEFSSETSSQTRHQPRRKPMLTRATYALSRRLSAWIDRRKRST
jgi:hypothetical protein